MQLEPHPFIRKIIIPWYIGRPVLWALLIVMVLVVIFSAIGIAVAQNNPNYRPFIWVPILLLALSTVMAFTTFFRIIQRSSSYSGEE